MNILIAPDKFKGTLTATQVCDAVEAGLIKSGQNFNIRKFPLADGGDGTLDIFIHHQRGTLVEIEVHDPLMRKIKAAYALSHDRRIAFIEMAKASGLGLLTDEERNPLKTTTYGSGELIRDALARGVQEIFLGIGGSATNDGGLGAAEALGFRFYDLNDQPVVPCGESLIKISRIESHGVHPKLNQVKITAMCDVTNPFYGEQGAAFIYAPQKGSSPEDVRVLDKGLQQVSSVFKKQFGIDVQQKKGAGAGGGFAGGAMALLNAELLSGVNTVFAMTNFGDAIAWADVVITGEGKLDEQSFQGKVVDGVIKEASLHQKRVIVVCGINELTRQQLSTAGVERVYSLVEFSGKEAALQKSNYVLTELVSAEILNTI